MRIMYASDEGQVETDLSLEQLRAALQEEMGIVWLDLNGEDSPEAENILSDVFAFHPLAVDDAINEVHLPKLDDWEAYLYLVLRGLEYEEAGHRVQLPELDIFLGEHYLVTFHHEPFVAIDRTWEACTRDQRFGQRGPAYVLYRLLDELVDHYITTVEAIEVSLEGVENEILARPTTANQGQILSLKHVVLEMRRVISLQREVLNKLARDEFSVVNADEQVYFRDVYDHMIRLYDLLEGLRDLVMGALDLYLSAINNRMNDVMKTLTLITTLFMPLSFITGFFGMNFFQPVLASLSPWTGRVVFFLVLLSMVLVPLTMFLWMRRRAWM